ncbi:MAG: peptide chain release factor-like protein [Planctomycetota bacterium]
MPLTLVESPHPSLLDDSDLLRQCDRRTQKRSGPGGQHRNKTSSGVFLEHSSGVIGEATERRSQHDNESVAIHRLRLQLSIQRRTTPGPEVELAKSIRNQGSGLPRMSSSNALRSRVLAILLDDTWACGGTPSHIAPRWQTTTSNIVRWIKAEPSAWTWLNQLRKFHGRPPLK